MAKEPLTVKGYASLGYDRLHREILKMVRKRVVWAVVMDGCQSYVST